MNSSKARLTMLIIVLAVALMAVLLINGAHFLDLTDYYIHQLNFTSFQHTMSDLVKMGPRRNDFNAPYIDDACTLSKTPNTNGKTNLEVALKYAEERFKSYGYQVSKEPAGIVYGSNLVATRTGSLYPQRIIEIGAHIDNKLHLNGLGTPGASDNASGVATVLEIARVMKDYQPSDTWRFVIFVGEEEDLVGSKEHVARIVQLKQDVRLALILDSTAWSEIAPQHMNCLWADPQLPASEAVAESFDLIRKRYNLPISWRHCDEGSGDFGVSDHIPYWGANIPAVLSIGGMPYQDPNYHGCRDTMSHTDVMNAFLTARENLGVLMLYDGK